MPRSCQVLTGFGAALEHAGFAAIGTPRQEVGGAESSKGSKLTIDTLFNDDTLTADSWPEMRNHSR